MADSSLVALRYVEESTWGTTPASALQTLRYTSESLVGNKETATSAEVVTDRQVSDLIATAYNSSGSIEGELSYGTYDDLIAGAMQADWPGATSVTASTISTDASGSTIDDSGSGFGSFSVGQFVSVSGFTGDTANNTVYRVTSVAAGSLGVFPAPNSTEAAGDSVTVKGEVISTGTSAQSFSFEKEYTDLSSVFTNYKGCRIDSFSQSFGAGEIATLSFGVLGQRERSTAATIGTGGPTAATTTTVMNAITDLVRVGENSVAQSDVLDVSFDLQNNLRTQPVVASSDPRGIGLGRAQITGTMTVYFTDLTLKDKFLDDTETSLEFAFEDTAGNAYGVYFPRIKYSAGPTTSPGNDQDVELELTWTALKDSTLSETILFTRMAA